jgi:hypothetical protein
MLDPKTDRSLKSPRQRKQVIFLVIVVLILGYIMAKEYQNLLKTFATNKLDVLKEYQLANDIHGYKIIVIKD